MGLKQQSALEFLVTYSWAFMVIALFTVSVFVLTDTKAPLAYLQSSCNIQPLLPCGETLLVYNSVSPLPIFIAVIITILFGNLIFFVLSI